MAGDEREPGRQARGQSGPEGDIGRSTRGVTTGALRTGRRPAPGGAQAAGRRIRSCFSASPNLSAKTSVDCPGLFQNEEITSSTAPVTAGGVRSSIAGACCAGSAAILAPFCAQMSIELVSTSVRTGIEPFFLLNSIWVVGSSSSLASCDLRLLRGRILGLREGEDVAAHGVAAAGLGQDGAAIFLAGRLARGDELALGPVAHDLEARLALDHQRGRVVPVAARRAGVDVGAQLGVGLGDVLELGALHRGLAPCRRRRRATASGRPGRASRR